MDAWLEDNAMEVTVHAARNDLCKQPVTVVITVHISPQI